MESSKIPYVIGGSGLLYFLGQQNRIGDWDILTDAPQAAVESALEEFSFSRVGPVAPFASAFLLRFQIKGVKFDVIGGFALRRGDEIRRFAAEAGDVVQGFPLAKVGDWAEIYDLIGKPEKAARLRQWQKENSII